MRPASLKLDDLDEPHAALDTTPGWWWARTPTNHEAPGGAALGTGARARWGWRTSKGPQAARRAGNPPRQLPPLRGRLTARPWVVQRKYA